MWALNNKTMPHEWLQLVSVVLEDRPQYCGNDTHKKMQKFWNKKEEQKDFRLSKIKFLARALMLIDRIKFFMMNTSCSYAIQQP